VTAKARVNVLGQVRRVYHRVVLTEILTIGDELCRGEIVDTNSSWLASALWDLDITVGWMTSCRDLVADIERSLALAADRADAVLVSGGLGPTEDDLTVEVVAALAGVEPVFHEPSRERMEKRFAKANFRITPNNLRQVRVPDGATAHVSPVGLAPAFEVAIAGTPVFCAAGVPRELRAVFDSALRQRLLELRDAAGGDRQRIARRVYRVFGKGESHVGAAVQGLTQSVNGASIHFQFQFPETLVKVVVRDSDPAAAERGLEEIDGGVRAALGRSLYGIEEDSLAAVTGRALSGAGLTLSTAESCTGGQIGSLVTGVPGSSEYYRGGAITYSNEEKSRQLGVLDATLREHGAVSEACVEEMARGCRERFGTDLAVAVSGIAGPGGGTPDKPVGTVWLGVAGPGGKCITKRFVWPGERDQIRTLAAFWGLAMVLAEAKVLEAKRGA